MALIHANNVVFFPFVLRHDSCFFSRVIKIWPNGEEKNHKRVKLCAMMDKETGMKSQVWAHELILHSTSEIITSLSRFLKAKVHRVLKRRARTLFGNPCQWISGNEKERERKWRKKCGLNDSTRGALSMFFLVELGLEVWRWKCKCSFPQPFRFKSFYFFSILTKTTQVLFLWFLRCQIRFLNFYSMIFGYENDFGWESLQSCFWQTRPP